jgi:cytochrome c oxidase subunit 2
VRARLIIMAMYSHKGLTIMYVFFVRLMIGTGLFVPLCASANGLPRPWQIGLQKAFSPMAQRIYDMHQFLLIIIFTVAIFVLLIMVYIMIRFRASRNPKPSKFTHNTWLEVMWTAVPLVVVAVIIVPSLRLLHYIEESPPAEMTIKAVGNQWYWSYVYPDHKDMSFDSYMIADEDLKPGQLRLLEVDNRVVVPVNTTIRVLITSNDVLHSWAVPSLGVKMDSVPGRLNETWIRVTKEGVYYGQCSEICGSKHGFMPIAVEAVSKDRFNQWIQQKKDEENL